MQSHFKFRHFPQLDTLRGLAVLLVVVGHVVEFSNTTLTGVANAIAQLGVMLFFILSGFLITGLLYRERMETGQVNLVNFYARRFLRLGPALFLFLGVVSLLVVFKKITDVPVYELAACLLYVRNIFGRSSSLAHIWSLSLEEQFYLLWPQVVKRVRLDRLLAGTLILTVLMCIWRGAAIQLQLFDYNTGVFYIRPYFRFDSILIGCCISLALAQSDMVLARLALLAKRVPATVAWMLLLVWTIWGEGWSRPLYITVQMLGGALVLLQLILHEPESRSVLKASAPLQYLGKISYSLYLWQQIFLVTKYPDWGILRAFPANVLLTFACAMASYHFVESPILRLKRRFESRAPNAPAPGSDAKHAWTMAPAGKEAASG
jgi:peptidoglycan/LPS O-acetylase OafA/YrhL